MSKWLSLLCALPALCAASDYAVQGASVHTMTGGGSLGQNLTILVSDGRVRAIGEGLAVPDGYEVIDAAGKVVTPGLIDAHTQLGLVEIGLEATTRDDAVSSYPLGPALDAADAFNGNSTLFAVNRRDGITRAVTAPIPGNDPFAGWGALVRLTDSEQIFDTRVAMFGSLVNDRWTGGSRAAVIQRVREGLLGARKLSPRRRDVREYRPADREALNALLTSRAPLVLEVHRAADIERAVRLAEDFDLRLVVLGGSEAWRVADLLAERDVPVVLDVLGNLPRRFDRLGARLDNAALLQAAGVTVIFTSEQTQNARWIRQGAGNAVAAGLPYDAALAAITRNPALTFGFPPGVGQIVVGGVADLVVWSGDPLEVSTWAERVMIDGKWQSMETRQTRLLERYRDLDARGLGFGYR